MSADEPVYRQPQWESARSLDQIEVSNNETTYFPSSSPDKRDRSPALGVETDELPSRTGPPSVQPTLLPPRVVSSGPPSATPPPVAVGLSTMASGPEASTAPDMLHRPEIVESEIVPSGVLLGRDERPMVAGLPELARSVVLAGRRNGPMPQLAPGSARTVGRPRHVLDPVGRDGRSSVSTREVVELHEVGSVERTGRRLVGQIAVLLVLVAVGVGFGGLILGVY